MKTKISTLFLALIATSAGTMFANGTKIGDLYYNLNANKLTAEVTYQERWSNYPYLTTVNIPESVEYNSVTYSVTSIGNYAFEFCYGLTSVTNYAATPQTINSDVFEEVNTSSCTLYVPELSISLYHAAEVWKDFGNIQAIADEQTAIGEVTNHQSPITNHQSPIRLSKIIKYTSSPVTRPTRSPVKRSNNPSRTSTRSDSQGSLFCAYIQNVSS